MSIVHVQRKDALHDFMDDDTFTQIGLLPFQRYMHEPSAIYIELELITGLI